MKPRRRYRKKPDQYIIAIQLQLETEGFSYLKWGSEQRCKKGDWLVDNDGDIYTIDDSVFAATYHEVEPGRYVKAAPVWAEIAQTDGAIATKEGVSNYKAGDYIVYNNEDGTDRYCVSAAKFEKMYMLDQ
jgi:hypothetical protein